MVVLFHVNSRMTILPPVEELKTFVELLEGFHNKFMAEYTD